VEYKEFVQTVSERSGLSRQEAADLTRATLEKLADRLSRTEAMHLALHLPDPLPDSLQPKDKTTPRSKDKAAQRFGTDEFIRRVSRHTGLTVAEATDGIRAILTTMRETVGDEEYRHTMAQVPAEFAQLAEPAS
jgi:uncharacterized protein (DUF2267 family)